MSNPFDQYSDARDVPRAKRSQSKKEYTRRQAASSNASTKKPEARSWIVTTPPEGTQRGIVVAVHKNNLEVKIDSEIVEATLPHVLSVEGDFVVGDAVWVYQKDVTHSSVVGREERKSFIGRARGDRTRLISSKLHVLAANIDVGVITVALKNPALHAKSIDRFLILLQEGDVTPVICLTKCDLSPERPVILDLYKSAGITVIETAAKEGKGVEELKKILKGKVAVFVGQSGVGKSSLVNAIDPELQLKTNTVSAKTGEGRHTTTNSSLYQWAEGSFIIDTPGIRSLGVELIPREELRFLFPEFVDLAQSCRYHDCLHLQEPGCAVKLSVEEKKNVVDPRRYASYVRMMEE